MRKTRPRFRVPPLFLIALLIWLAHGLLHTMGLRDFVSVISGTPVQGFPPEAALPIGMLYLLTYMAAVLVAPVLALAAALLELLRARAPLREEPA